ncbi:MAG: LysM peptidoglycan-binding domain-containing protein [Chloroflexi bacterium]|nr:LysM peptidoglycan-binding domain-containing protein [Chloroflexota bacterium]
MAMQARSTGEPELLQAQRRRREAGEAERRAPRRARRRRSQTTPWLQRNALSVAAASILVAFLGLGFGLLQMLNHGDGSVGSPLTLAQADLGAPTSTSANVLSAAAVGASVPVVAESVTALDAPRSIHANVKVLTPDYTVAAGDTLVRIAQRYSTTVERIQAFNNLSDPRALHIGAQLIIPPPF